MAALLLTGCSGENSEYGYAIPGKICDVSVASSDVKPLLPPGRAIKESLRGTPDESLSCGLIVDERVDLSISFSRQSGELDIAEEAADDYVNLKRITLGGNVTSAAVGDDGAVAWAKCVPKPGQRQYESPESEQGRYGHLVLEIHAGDDIKEPDNLEEWRAHIEKFLRSYVPELVKVWCSG
ncbi:hypothetical protein ABZZ04_22540 [Streptomyces sp. NPDC006435]|uniref:hypothetical protein n=1 Tax=Streptomyces sp. NPDC006435 TaxID=3154300 RepID=UPI0033A27787